MNISIKELRALPASEIFTLATTVLESGIQRSVTDRDYDATLKFLGALHCLVENQATPAAAALLGR